MLDLSTAKDLAPPRVEITVELLPVPGQPDKRALSAPQLTFHNMPGGWATVHMLLLRCLSQVADEMVREAQGKTLALQKGQPIGVEAHQWRKSR